MNTFHITNRLLKSTLFCGLLLFSSSALSCSSDDDGGGNGGTQLEWLEPIRVASYNIQYDNSSDQDNKWTSRIHLDRHERDGRRQCGAPSFQSDILQDRQIRSARKRFVLVFGDAQRSQYEILRLLFPAHVQLGAFPREGHGQGVLPLQLAFRPYRNRRPGRERQAADREGRGDRRKDPGLLHR